MPIGTKILAAADGKIVAMGNNGRYAYGRWMAIDHGNGIVTMYGHLSAYVKSKGLPSKQGTWDRRSGNTGNSTGPHLHFTVFFRQILRDRPIQIRGQRQGHPGRRHRQPENYLP